MGGVRRAFDAFGVPDRSMSLDLAGGWRPLPRQQTPDVRFYDGGMDDGYGFHFLVSSTVGDVQMEHVLSLLMVGSTSGFTGQDRELWHRLEVTRETWKPPGIVRQVLTDMIARHNMMWSLYHFNRSKPDRMRPVARLDEAFAYAPGTP